MARQMPQYAVLKCLSNNKYVSCTSDGSIRADGADALSPRCKLQLERYEYNVSYYRIKSFCNNKYWAEEVLNSSTRVKAGVAKPKGTLFSPAQGIGTDEPLRIHCPFRSAYLRCEGVGGDIVVGDHGTDGDKFMIMDWTSLVILPKHVAFKGDNGNYLAARWIEGHEYHKFDGNDICDPRVAYEIFPTGRGRAVRIKSSYFNKFWRRSPNWIWADSSDNEHNNEYEKDTSFMPVRVDYTNTIGLRNLGNNNFCIRLSKEGKENCLNADVGSIEPRAMFTVEEAVSSREIDNIKYHLTKAKIYDESILTMAATESANHTSVPETVSVTLKYTETSSKTWEYGLSLSMSVSGSMNFSTKYNIAGYPLIDVGGQIGLTVTAGGFSTWSHRNESSKEVSTTQTVTVPPKKRVKMSVYATQGKCDVPYSYTQRDVLADGRVATYYMDDGRFTGVNSYNFRYETTEHPL